MNTQNKGEVAAVEPHLLRKLFSSFFKIGGFTFGGGWAMISLVERELVDNRKWLPREEFLDLLAIAQSLPGILAVNMATIMGNRLRGMKGAVTSATATILPSFLIILFIAIFLTPDMIKNNHIISAIFMGIRPAVVALIIAPVITSAKAAKITYKTVWIPLITALMISFDIGWISNPIVYVILGGVGGYIYFKYTQKLIAKSNNK
jgi:chromate transporter